MYCSIDYHFQGNPFYSNSTSQCPSHFCYSQYHLVLNKRAYCFPIVLSCTIIGANDKECSLGNLIRIHFSNEWNVPWTRFQRHCTWRIGIPGITTTYPQFFKRKASAKSLFSVVFKCWTSYNWPKWSGNRSWGDLQSFLLSSNSPSLLSARLIKPCLYIILPVFTEMCIRDHIIVLHPIIKRISYQ